MTVPTFLWLECRKCQQWYALDISAVRYFDNECPRCGEEESFIFKGVINEPSKLMPELHCGGKDGH